MEEKIKLTDGREYPCFQTMGALARYARIQGRDLGGAMNMNDLATWLFCLTSEASRAMGVEFPFPDVEAFACFIGVEEFTAWSSRMTEMAEPKKKASPSA